MACAALLALSAIPAGARAFSLDAELKNFAKILEREQHITLTPEFLTLLAAQSANAPLELLDQLATDPERVPANICGLRGFECAGDVRFYDWAEQGYGLRTPVLFTARSGATISGNVWATEAGPPQRPAIVITTGSVQAPEELYWAQAAVLAKHGYVVLTYDVQGQGRSDTLGEGADAFEGVPAQQGRPFYDGTEDALDFLLSSPAAPYVPRDSCTSGTSHAPKQGRRVASGLNADHNPFSELVDPSRIGIAGHSLGAAAVSYVGQEDPRVDAIVAWDNLGSSGGAVDPGTNTCASAPETRAEVPVTVPAIGISNDYGIVPSPFLTDPDPQDKNRAFLSYRNAGADSAEISIRGGCHEESAFIPGTVTGPYPLGCGTLRGTDLVAWYTTAWFDKYVKGDPGGDALLLSDRWRDDSRGGAVDLSGDGNLFSFYYRSRYDFGLAGGGRAVCDDMREGCADMGPDGLPADYTVIGDAFTPDGPTPDAQPSVAGGAVVPPASAPAGKKAAKALRRCRHRRGKAKRRCVKRAAKRVRRQLAA